MADCSEKRRLARSTKESRNARRQRVQRRLLAYSATAGAAMAVAGATAPANASIIYSGPENITLGQNSSATPNFAGVGSVVTIVQHNNDAASSSQTIYVKRAGHGGLFKLLAADNASVMLLAKSAAINAAGTWGNVKGRLVQSFTNGNPSAGQFLNKDGYIGVKFTNPNTSQTDYGWIELANSGGADSGATIEGWAYENSGGSIKAGQTVEAPEPGTLAMLAAGLATAACAAFFARRKSAPQ